MYDNKGCDLLDFEESDFNTVMASDISFSGKIRFTKPFMIKGQVSGKIEADSDLVIAQDAVVKADIVAERIFSPRKSRRKHHRKINGVCNF